MLLWPRVIIVGKIGRIAICILLEIFVMISASEARDKSNKVLIECKESILQKLEQKINSASSGGLHSITINNTELGSSSITSNLVTQTLTKLGYKVERCSDSSDWRDASLTTISW